MARDCIADRLKRPAHATMNKIFIHDLRLDTKVGVYEWERKLAQTVRIDVDIGLPSSRPFETGELADAIDYAAVVARIRAFGASHDHALLERFAEALAAVVLDEFGALAVLVRVAKRGGVRGVGALGVATAPEAGMPRPAART